MLVNVGFSIFILIMSGLLVSEIKKIRKGKKKEEAQKDPGMEVKEGGEGLEPSVSSRPFKIGSFDCDAELPTKHVLISATTGAGKSQMMHTILDRVLWGVDQRPSAEKAIITDSGGVFLKSRGTEKDLILNPNDARSLKWNPFLEIKKESDFDLLAKAVLPDSPYPGKAEWVGYGRNLLIDIMKAMKAKGEADVKKVSFLMAQAAPEELDEYLVGTASVLLLQPAGEKILQSVRFEVTDGIRPWRYLDPNGDFSIRDWIQKGSGTIFMTYKDSEMDAIAPLIRTWLGLAIRETLSLEEDFNRRVWFVMDELDSLGKVDYLDSALSKGRKYGLSVISAIQSIAQLDHKYGHDLSKVLRSVHVSKIIMRQGSNDDAEYWSREIGEQLKWESSFSNTATHTGVSTGSSRALQQRRVVLPAELMSLKDLTGYAILQDRPEISFFEIPLQKYDKKIEAFIDREEA